MIISVSIILWKGDIYVQEWSHSIYRVVALPICPYGRYSPDVGSTNTLPASMTSIYHCTAPRPPVLSVSSVTPTSFTVSWSVQDFSPTVVQFRVQLTRVIGSDDDDSLCSTTDGRPPVTPTGTSMLFSGLHEFSTYTFVMNTEVEFLGNRVNQPATMDFETLSIGMCGQG